MDKKLKLQILIVVLLYVITFYIALPVKNKPLFREGELLEKFNYKLGLDIIGGTEIRLAFKESEKLTTEEKRLGIDNAVNIIERRINIYGLKEPRIQPLGGEQILIQLPGATKEEIDQIKNLVQKTGKVEFRLECKEDETGCINFPDEKEPGKTYSLKSTASMDGSAIASAKVAIGSGEEGIISRSAYHVSFKIKPQFIKKFAQLTKENIGNNLAILLDGKVVSNPVIKGEIPTGDGAITGRFTREEAQALATVLNTGALPQALQIVSEETVGPTLGENSIKQGIYSLAIATALVVIFMLIIYNISGFAACLALLLNLLLLLTIVNIFGATLTLPGLAGIVLTLAMALDANILIFERIKEEYAAGKTILAALEAAHTRALSAIIDANLTTLITGIILTIFGSGSMKGFGITLSIGILTTLFTAVYIAKFFLKLMMESKVLKSINYLSLIKTTKINFLKPAPALFIFSILVIVITISLAIVRGSNVFNIDFTGGSIIGITTKEAYKPDEIQARLLELKITEKGVQKSKYADVEVQGIGEQELTSKTTWGYKKFQIRTKFQNTEEFQNDIKKQLQDMLVETPIEEPKVIESGPKQGMAQMVLNFSYNIKVEEFEKKIKDLFTSNNWGRVFIDKEKSNVQKGFIKKAIIYTEAEHSSASELNFIRSTIYKEFKFDKYESIIYSSNVGSVVASELKEKAAWALIFSWIAMIIYLWFRFEFIYGVAAVAALIHDVLVSFGITALVGMLFPHSLGITLQMGMNAIAALLTVVGYSVNDTIVIFDFIRENQKVQKKIKFYDIINMSLNQTLSRTILTSLTVFFASIILFLFSYTSNSSLAVLSFILIIGTISGTYSTIYIASYIAHLFKEKENETAS